MKNMFKIWDRVQIKEGRHVRGGRGTIVKDLFTAFEQHSMLDQDPSSYVSVKMDDGEFYKHVHVGWLELLSPTKW